MITRKLVLIRALGIIIMWIDLLACYSLVCLSTLILSASIRLVALIFAFLLSMLVTSKVGRCIKRLYQSSGLQTTKCHSPIIEPILVFAIAIIMYVADPTAKQIDYYFQDYEFSVNQAFVMESYRFLPTPLKIYAYDNLFKLKWFEANDAIDNLEFPCIVGSYNYPVQIIIYVGLWLVPATIITKRYELIEQSEVSNGSS